jgi:raw score 9.87
MYQLGRFYHIGEVVEADYDKAMTLYHRANALGYPLAASNIGALYDDMGEPEKSVEWFEQGIRQGDKRATINLGRFYLLGIGVEQDTFKGMQMLEKYDNNGLASYLLAQIYDGVIGYDVPINYPKALEYYLLAEKNKQDLPNKDLMTLYNNLGTLYNAHEDIPTNYVEAQKYLTKAAEMGFPHAMYGLANLHGFKGDKKQAFKWYLKAAENGLIDAYYYVGNAYKRGDEIEQNYEDALKWYAAAEQGDADAQNSLYNRYAKGEGVEQNSEEAMKWLHRSADQGHGLAYYNLGFEYSSGVLVKKMSWKRSNGIKKR